MSDRSIVKKSTVKQVTRPIPFDIDDLLIKPRSEEIWLCYLVPAKELDDDTSRWGQIRYLPPIHVVGMTPDEESYEVAVCNTALQWLVDHHMPGQVLPQQQRPASGPRERESRVYGIDVAKRKAQIRLLRNAIRGIQSRFSRGFNMYTRQSTDKSLLAPIEWAILMNDIKGSEPEVLQRFLVHSLLLTLDLLDDSPAPELLDRTQEQWVGKLLELSSRKTMNPAEDWEAEIYQVSLLRMLLQSAGGEDSGFPHTLDTTKSANDNLAVLCHVFDVDIAEPVTLGRRDPPKTEETLLRSPLLLEFGNLDVERMREQIRHYVPYPSGFLHNRVDPRSQSRNV